MSPHRLKAAFCCVLFAFVLTAPAADAQTLLPFGSTWRYFKGSAEASNPTDLWRAKDFNDSAWASGPAPFYYGETFSSGTVISDMRNNYTTLFFRQNFSVANPGDIDRLAIRTRIDDGFIIWINAKEVTPRFNAPGGEPVRTNLAGASIEMTWVTNTCAAADYLVTGVNTIAVQVFNQALNSSDIVFDLQIDSATDRVPPRILSINPAPGDVQQLGSITVTFSEPVQGVSAGDLLINNSQATGMTSSGNSYTFTFNPPAFGIVDLSWEAGHQITDLANPPHDFDETAAGASWRIS